MHDTAWNVLKNPSPPQHAGLGVGWITHPVLALAVAGSSATASATMMTKTLLTFIRFPPPAAVRSGALRMLMRGDICQRSWRSRQGVPGSRAAGPCCGGGHGDCIANDLWM